MDSLKGDEGPTGPRGKRGPIGAIAGMGAIIIKKGGLLVSALANTLNFDTTAFTAATSPGSQVNVGMAFGVGAGQPAQGNHVHGYTPTITARSNSVSVPNATIGTCTATCNAGEKVVGGGFSVGQPSFWTSICGKGAGETWQAQGSNATGVSVTLSCTAMCLVVPFSGIV